LGEFVCKGEREREREEGVRSLQVSGCMLVRERERARENLLRAESMLSEFAKKERVVDRERRGLVK
jgi:hypothetical protein